MPYNAIYNNNNNNRNKIAVFKVVGYLIEERHRWPVIFQINSEFLKERHIQINQMRKPYQLPGWTKNSSYYSAPVGDQTRDLPPP